jgi:hypothetical protein
VIFDSVVFSPRALIDNFYLYPSRFDLIDNGGNLGTGVVLALAKAIGKPWNIPGNPYPKGTGSDLGKFYGQIKFVIDRLLPI